MAKTTKEVTTLDARIAELEKKQTERLAKLGIEKSVEKDKNGKEQIVFTKK